MSSERMCSGSLERVGGSKHDPSARNNSWSGYSFSARRWRYEFLVKLHSYHSTISHVDVLAMKGSCSRAQMCGQQGGGVTTEPNLAASCRESPSSGPFGRDPIIPFDGRPPNFLPQFLSLRHHRARKTLVANQRGLPRRRTTGTLACPHSTVRF